MIYVIWAEVNEPSMNSGFPRLREAAVVRLNDEIDEPESIRIDGAASDEAFDEEVLRDWEALFAAVFAPLPESEKRTFVFPHSKQRNRFYYMKSKCSFRDSHDTYNGTLGALLAEGGGQPEADVGIPKMLEILQEYDIEALIEQGYLKYNKNHRSRREGIFSNQGYLYFGDLEAKQYHLRTCRYLDAVNDANLVGLGKNPVLKGWKPCPHCMKGYHISQVSAPSLHSQEKSNPPQPLPKLGWEKLIDKAAKGSTLTKAQIIKRELTKACEEYGMYAEYAGGTVFVTTVAGEWFFDYNDRPIRLHHKNYTDRTKQLGRSLSHYHLQDKRFASPLHAVQYISEHDIELKRRIMQEAESEMAADEYLFGDTEMNVVNKAIAFAAKAHEGAVRKGTTLPYILHPTEAASIAASITDDAEVIAAAALHDVLEDTDVNAAKIQLEFGVRVRKLVESESENKRPGLPASKTWRVRKQETIDYLHDHATTEERIIALADKLSNIRACLRDYHKEGDRMWSKFNMPDKKMQAWYYKSVRNALGRLQDTEAWKEFNDAVNELFAETN